jgi:hypothetical protein
MKEELRIHKSPAAMKPRPEKQAHPVDVKRPIGRWAAA